MPLDADTLREIEEQTVELAWRAGAVLLEHFQTPLHVEYKGKRAGSAPVTEADRRVEEFLQEELARRFPEHAVVGEEGAGAGERGGGPDLGARPSGRHHELPERPPGLRIVHRPNGGGEAGGRGGVPALAGPHRGACPARPPWRRGLGGRRTAARGAGGEPGAGGGPWSSPARARGDTSHRERSSAPRGSAAPCTAPPTRLPWLPMALTSTHSSQRRTSGTSPPGWCWSGKRAATCSPDSAGTPAGAHSSPWSPTLRTARRARKRCGHGSSLSSSATRRWSATSRVVCRQTVSEPADPSAAPPPPVDGRSLPARIVRDAAVQSAHRAILPTRKPPRTSLGQCRPR